MDPTTQTQLIRFLQEDLAVPTDSLDIALRHQEYRGQLPMILWRYGLVTLDQLDQIFDWLEAAAPTPALGLHLGRTVLAGQEGRETGEAGGGRGK